MNCFELVKSVLEEIYDRMPGTEARKDKRILEKMRFLEEEYQKLAAGNARIDYKDEYTRFAYIYKYVTSHANIVYQLVQSSDELRELFKRDRVNVACIGGGPGSDFLGVLKYVMNRGLQPRLKCTLFDAECSWGECWCDVDDKLETELPLRTVFQPFSVVEPNTYENLNKYLTSDLVTLIYFMSEVHRVKEDAEPYFKTLFQGIKQGALFLYVDNNNRQFYDWFDRLARENDLEVLDREEGNVQIEDLREEKKDLGEYYDKFGSPKLRGDIAYRICRKT